MGSMKDLLGDTPYYNPTLAARRTDPDTSKAAAKAATGLASKHHAAIIAAMKATGRPMAGEEIADAIGGIDKVMIGRRMIELERAGQVEKAGELYRNRSGRNAERYQLKAAP